MELITLKGGHITSDPRLDRVPQWDPKNLNYDEREILETFAVPQAGPRGYTWRCPHWLDQGQEGACVGFSWSHELIAWPAEIDVNDAWAKGLYLEAQTIDEWPGTDYSGTSVLAGAKTVKKRGYMDEYRWATSIDDLILAIGWHGPAVLGVSWLDSDFNPRPSGLLAADGKVAGGHAILCRGVQLRPRLKGEKVKEPVFRLRNSWGKDWGLDGDCYVKASDLEQKLFEGSVEACIPVIRDKKPVADITAMSKEGVLAR